MSTGKGTAMTGPSPAGDADETDESFSKVVAETQERLARLARLQATAEQVSVSATSPDGAVTVTVNTSGALTGLRINDRLSGQPGARIAEAVLATTRQAQARIAGTMSEVMRDIIGDDPEIADGVMALYRTKFPPPPPQQQRPPSVDEVRFEQPPGYPPPPVPAPMKAPRRTRQPSHADENGWENPDEPIMEET